MGAARPHNGIASLTTGVHNVAQQDMPNTTVTSTLCASDNAFAKQDMSHFALDVRSTPEVPGGEDCFFNSKHVKKDPLKNIFCSEKKKIQIKVETTFCFGY